MSALSRCASAVLASIALALPCLASRQDASAPAKPAESKAQPARFVWTGTTIAADGSRTGRAPIVAETSTSYGAGSKPAVTRANPRATADALLQALAAVELSIEVDRKLDDAQSRLDELQVRASWKEPYVGRAEVLQKTALARSKLFETRGKREEATRALEHLLPDETTKQALGARFELVAASAEDLAAESKALDAPAVKNAAATLTRGAQANTPTAVQSQGVESIVRVALSNCQPQVIREIGQRAVPVLEKIVLESPDDLTSGPQCDPLTLLFDLSEARSAELVLGHLDAGSFLWRKRILRSMSQSDVLGNSWMYSSDEHAKPTMVEPVWGNVLERLLDDPDVGGDVLLKLDRFVNTDALTPEMRDALTHALLDGDTERQQAAMRVLKDGPGRETVRPIFEAALRSPKTTVRRFAAQMLLDEPKSEALLTRADDPDVEVRRTVVRSMQQRTIRVPYYQERTNAIQQTNVRPTLGDEERAALEKLVRDADADVRREAVWVILSLKRPLAPDVYVRLASEGDTETRKALAKLELSNPAFPAVLEVLAADPSPEVRAAYDVAITQVARQTSVLSFSAYLDGFLKRAANLERPGTDPMNNSEELLAPATRSALRHAPGTKRLLELARAPEAEWLVKQIGANFPWPRKEDESDVDPVLRGIDEASFAAFVRRMDAMYASLLGTFADGALRAAKIGFVHREAWRSILVDPTASRSLRTLAAAVEAPVADATIEDGIRALLSDAAWAAQPVQRQEQSPLSQLGKTFRPERIGPFFLGLIQDGRTQDVPLTWIVGNVPNETWVASWSMAILERWLEAPDPPRDLVQRAFGALPVSEDAKTIATLRKGLRSSFANYATFALARMKRPAHLELLTEALDASWISDANLRAAVQQAAIAGLTSTMNEAAAEKLLGAVTLASNDATRKLALDGLEQIRKYLDEKKRWTLRDTDLEKREQAVKELLVLLGDADATTRAQAAKSLATLDAVEQLPRLVLLLKDKSPEVRTAAQQAIDQLNARSAKPK